MSHEIAHALARHGGERMSHTMASDGIKKVAEKLAGTYVPDKSALLMQAYGVGTKYGVLLPYNRRQESEADRIGVDLMAKAGYDPSAAPAFWSRFGAAKGETQAEFFSTHPSDQRRSQDLMSVMDDALSVYQQAPVKYGQGVGLFS
jgi:predicted Zn-dependent protease